jgi:hypothetical protein
VQGAIPRGHDRMSLDHWIAFSVIRTCASVM